MAGLVCSNCGCLKQQSAAPNLNSSCRRSSEEKTVRPLVRTHKSKVSGRNQDVSRTGIVCTAKYRAGGPRYCRSYCSSKSTPFLILEERCRSAFNRRADSLGPCRSHVGKYYNEDCGHKRVWYNCTARQANYVYRSSFG